MLSICYNGRRKKGIMRFLHTADWHIGKTLQEYSLIDHQRHALKQIVNLCRSNQYDVLIVAGDLYDRAQPSSQSLELVDEIFKEILLETKTPILLISGNHDGPALIEYGSYLNKEAGLFASGILKDEMLKVTKGDTDFYLFPFITPARYTEAKDYQELFEKELSKITFDNKQNVLIAHGYFVYNNYVVEKEDSVKPLSVGTTEYVSAQLVKQFDYVALGHIHSPQTIVKDKVLYSGSICKYSKSEVKNKISVVDVTIENNEVTTKRIKINPLQEVVIKQGYLEDLLKQPTNDFVFYELLDETYQVNALGRLKQVALYTCGISYINITQKVVEESLKTTSIETQSVYDLYEEYFMQNFDRPLNDFQKEVVESILKEVKLDEA